VKTDKIRAPIPDLRNDGIRQLNRAHLRLQIVGRYFRRRDHDPPLALERRLAAAAEEKADMRIFFGLCDAYLFQPMLRDDLAERVLEIVVFEHYPDPLEPRVVLGHGCIMKG